MNTDLKIDWRINRIRLGVYRLKTLMRRQHYFTNTTLDRRCDKCTAARSHGFPKTVFTCCPQAWKAQLTHMKTDDWLSSCMHKDQVNAMMCLKVYCEINPAVTQRKRKTRTNTTRQSENKQTAGQCTFHCCQRDIVPFSMLLYTQQLNTVITRMLPTKQLTYFENRRKHFLNHFLVVTVCQIWPFWAPIRCSWIELKM